MAANAVCQASGPGASNCQISSSHSRSVVGPIARRCPTAAYSLALIASYPFKPFPAEEAKSDLWTNARRDKGGAADTAKPTFRFSLKGHQTLEYSGGEVHQHQYRCRWLRPYEDPRIRDASGPEIHNF